MASVVQRWLKISLINLLIVAAIGVVLRYKILFALPFINQKYVLHGHSHFAFAGWITQAIMVLLIAYLDRHTCDLINKKYKWLLYANVITAYGMLISFIIGGYGLFSIIFSTLSIIVSYIFSFFYWKDLNKLKEKNITHLWFKSAVLFNSISSLGAFALAFMMMAKMVHRNWYLAAEYFYLHFQYNGWFFFAFMGLITTKLFHNTSPIITKRIFLLFSTALVPAYFLSALWMNIPTWVYILVVIAAFAQIIGWLYTIGLIKKYFIFIKLSFPNISKWLLLLSAVALSFKLLLQLGSTIPSLSNLAFGFRPIVIGYLHLVLLGVITLGLLGYMFSVQAITLNKLSLSGAITFSLGIIINELLLMTQGLAALNYTRIPFINEALFITALIIFLGMMLLVISQKKSTINFF
jgi:hypothetical protein